MKKPIIIMVCIVLLIISLISLTKGCDSSVESNFQLAPESRLPKWFDIKEYSRNDLSMKITYYTGGKVKMVLYGPAPERKKLMEKTGTTRWHPSMKNRMNKFGGFDPDVYPMLTIETVDGITEILEQRRSDDVLYVSDDPELKKSIMLP